MDMTTKNIGFIGLGKMASAIISGLDKQTNHIFAAGRDFEKTQKSADLLGITALSDLTDLVAKSDIIILSVKPQILPSVLTAIASNLTGKTIVSIAAGLKLADLEDLADAAFVRVMPNINAEIQQSTSAIVRNNKVSDGNFALVKNIFEQCGTVHEIAEKDFSNFTALAGSSPAYIYMFIDALSRAGVLHGLPKDVSTKIVAETVAASAQMVLNSDDSPMNLVDKVCSPAGTTIAGVNSLEQNKFTGTVMEAITATIEKEKRL